MEEQTNKSQELTQEQPQEPVLEQPQEEAQEDLQEQPQEEAQENLQEQPQDAQEALQEAPSVVKIAVSVKGAKILVDTLDGIGKDAHVDGIAIMDSMTAIIVSLTEEQLPFGGESADAPENSATTSNDELNGEERTDYLIAYMHLTEGTACVEAKKVGWLPSVGEWRVIMSHIAAVNEKLDEVGGAAISGLYWTSSLFSEQHAWHLDTDKGFRMNSGMSSVLSVRSIFSADGYVEQ